MALIEVRVNNPMKRLDSQFTAVNTEKDRARMRDGTISVSTIQQIDPWPREKPEMKISVAATAFFFGSATKSREAGGGWMEGGERVEGSRGMGEWSWCGDGGGGGGGGGEGRGG